MVFLLVSTSCGRLNWFPVSFDRTLYISPTFVVVVAFGQSQQFGYPSTVNAETSLTVEISIGLMRAAQMRAASAVT